MTAEPVLYLPQTWCAPAAPSHDVLLFVDDDGLRFTPLGTTEALRLSPDDWAALVDFVAQHTALPMPHAAGRAGGRGGRVGTLDADAVIARLRALSPDGVHMPPQLIWRDERGPGMPGRSTMVRVRSWREWGQLAGLYPHVPFSDKRVASPDPPAAPAAEPVAPQPAAASTSSPAPTPAQPPASPDPARAGEQPDLPTPDTRPSAHRGKPRQWTDDQVVTALRSLATGGEMPSRVEWDAKHGPKLPSAQTIVKAHAWEAWAALAGLRYDGRRRQPSSEISAARRAAQALRGDLPMVRVNGKPAAPTMAAVRASAHRQQRERSQRDLLAAVRAKLHEIAEDGRMPTLRLFDLRRGDLPPGLTILTELGLTSWGKLAAVCDLEYGP